LPDDPIEPKPDPDDEKTEPKPAIEPAKDEVESKPEPKQRDIAKETAEQMMDAAPSRTFDTQDRELAYQRFLLSADYLPVTRRQLKQSWRYLRRQVRQGPPAEIDISATVRHITEDGFFLTPVMRPRRINKAALLLLIDQNGSMAPFHVLSRRLEKTIQSAGNLGQVGIYYFHDCPAVVRDGRIYTDLYREHSVTSHPQGLHARQISNILAEFDLNYSSVLIFSDAGAARGSWDDERIEA
ncbi:MAG: VWA domain-containing protein, partial [Chloroflexi bacterium]|nr:VWA domain-containing protein [Chloroflexota bacterium]